VFAEILRSGKGIDRGRAAAALGSLGEAARPYVRDLVALLAHEDPYYRVTATKALGDLGTVAKDAIPELQNLEKDEEAEIRAAAETAIRKIREALAAAKR
jgi:HEAT repeat protein